MIFPQGFQSYPSCEPLNTRFAESAFIRLRPKSAFSGLVSLIALNIPSRHPSQPPASSVSHPRLPLHHSTLLPLHHPSASPSSPYLRVPIPPGLHYRSMPAGHLGCHTLAQSYCWSDDCLQDTHIAYSSSPVISSLAAVKERQTGAHAERMQDVMGGSRPRRVWRPEGLLQLGRRGVCRLVLESPLGRIEAICL